MKIMLPVFLLFLLLMNACGPSRSEFKALQSEASSLRQQNQAFDMEVTSLKQEIEKLKADLENLYFKPQRLLAQAQTNLKERQYSEAKAVLESILQEHPSSCESSEAGRLLEQANQAVKAEAEAAEVKRRKAEAEEQKRIAAATSQMRVTVDAAQGVTWYEDRNVSRNNNMNKFYLMIGIKKDKPVRLQLAQNYAAKNWLSIDSFTIVADDKKFESGLARFERSDIQSGFIFEYSDIIIGPQEMEWIRAIIASKKAAVQYHGEQASVAIEISQNQKRSLQNALNAFFALGGTLEK